MSVRKMHGVSHAAEFRLIGFLPLQIFCDTLFKYPSLDAWGREVGHTFTRQGLYELVWSEPMKVLAARYNISDVGLAKACRHAGIPVPERGYWAKKQAGKKVPKAQLSPKFPGASDFVSIGGEERGYDENKLITEPPPVPPVFDEEIQSVSDCIEKMVGTVVCPKSIGATHPLIARKLEQDAVRAANPHGWDKPKYTDGLGKRWLRILNTLFLELQRLGCHPEMSRSKYSNDDEEIRVGIGSQGVRFKLTAPQPRNRWRQEPQSANTKLRLELMTHCWGAKGASRVWVDSEAKQIEDMLRDIVVAFLKTAESQCRENALAHHRWLLERRTEAIQERERRKIEAERKAREYQEQLEKERIEKLLADADALQKADKIREYVAAIRNKSKDMPVSAEQIDHWANWALEQADRIDPSKTLLFLEGGVRKTSQNTID